MVSRAISLGMHKINIATASFMAVHQAAQLSLQFLQQQMKDYIQNLHSMTLTVLSGQKTVLKQWQQKALYQEEGMVLLHLMIM